MSYNDYSKNLKVDKANGVMTFDVTAKGSPFVMTAANETTDPTPAYGLNYNPAGADVVRVRFKPDGCTKADSMRIAFCATNTGSAAGIWKSNAKSFTYDSVNGKVTLDHIFIGPSELAPN